MNGISNWIKFFKGVRMGYGWLAKLANQHLLKDVFN
jgi:hypothetical protein